jgi:hypothetical protein
VKPSASPLIAASTNTESGFSAISSISLLNRLSPHRLYPETKMGAKIAHLVSFCLRFPAQPTRPQH